MPALYTLWNTRLEKRWNVGSDDFVLPSILAISVRLLGFVLIVGVLVYLFAAPLGCEDETLTTPPWLYGTLFATLLLEFAVVIDDGIIMSKSCRGRIDHSKEIDPEEAIMSLRSDMTENSTVSRQPDPDSTSPRRGIKRYLCCRILLFVFEIILSALYGYACWSPALTDQLLTCDEFQGPIYFARAVAIVWWIVTIITCLLWLYFLDPVGICSSGLIDQLDFLDQVDEIVDPTEHNLFKFHRASVGKRRIRRRLQTIFCCLGLGGNQERGSALEDAAKVMQTIFDDVDLVGSDLLAGLILLNRDQRQKMRKNECLISKFKKLTFQNMGDIPEGYDSEGNCLSQPSHPPFNTEDGYLQLDDLLHYCHYAVGVYGWPLYVYGHPLTGCCALTVQTCKRLYCHRLAARARSGDIIADNLCFCGFASVQLQSPSHSLQEADIKHITFKNDYFECPFLLCVDHARQAVVVCVRGTLSFKDVLTDITVSLKKLTKDDIGEDIKEAHVHRGMYRTAMGIRSQLLDESKPILMTTCKENSSYRLVIVGHSLGAGVASVLAVLLKKQFPDVVCYAYSPPGCVFSFPLAKYSRDFITSVAIGNDMVPRLSIRALHYMKREIEYLLKRCKKPKHQVLFQPRRCDILCHTCSSETTDPSVCIEDFQDKLFEQSRSEIDGEIDNNLAIQSPVLPPRPPLNRGVSLIGWGCCGDNTIKRSADVHSLVKKVTKPEKTPTFAPGDILHIVIKYRNKACCFGASCNPPEIETSWMKGEDLGVIIADKGMLEDHMPTHVISTLRAYHREVSGELSEDLRKRMKNGRSDMMANDEIRNKIEQRDIRLERGHVQADSRDDIHVGWEDVDGVANEDFNDMEEVVNQSKDTDRHSEFDVGETFEEVDGGEGFDGGVSVSEAGPHANVEDESGINRVLVVESYEGGYSELQPMDTVL